MTFSASPDARRIHDEAVVVDAHADTIGRALDGGEEIAARTARGHVDLDRLREGGVDVQFFSCFVEPKYVEGNGCVRRALRMIDAVKRTADRAPDRLALAGSAAEIHRVVASGRRAGVLCIEGGHAIEDDLGVLRLYHELGVRYLTLTWNNSNNWADGCGGPMTHHGLSPFGREVVREMNRIGMIVDISHVAEKTFYDALETSSVPVICSHSSVKAICAHRRNLTDDQIRSVARNGGVVCVNFYSGFLSEEFRVASMRLDQEREAESAAARLRHEGDPSAAERAVAEVKKAYDRKEAELPRPPFDLLMRHLEHLIGVGGADHVGLGSDFDGVSSLPEGIDDCTDLPRITESLLRRGHPASDVKKILGGNLLRVIEASVDSRLPATSA